MSTTNPYDVDLDKFDIEYVGMSDDYYCFRLDLAEHKGLDSCMFQMAVSQWLFDNTQGKWYMGNDFPYKDHPAVKLYNPGFNDYFVLLSSLADSAMFEHEFKISGLTPTMLI